jgi:hypothetical protein
MEGAGAPSGSFAGKQFTLEVDLDQTYAEIQQACGTFKGLKTLTWAPDHHRQNGGWLDDDAD